MHKLAAGILVGIFAGLLVPYLNGELAVTSPWGVVTTFVCYFGFAFTVIGTIVGYAAVRASTQASREAIRVSRQKLQYQMLDKRYKSVLEPLIALISSSRSLRQGALSKLQIKNHTRFYDCPKHYTLLNSWAQAANMLRVLYNDDDEELWRLSNEVISYATKLIDSQESTTFSSNQDKVEDYGSQLVKKLVDLSKIKE